MKKVSIIYWSCGGVLERFSKEIKNNFSNDECKIVVKDVVDADISDVIDSDLIMLGSPSMNDDMIEQYHMEPFVEKLEKIDMNKKVILFGTCEYNSDSFLNVWKDRMTKSGFEVIKTIGIRNLGSEKEIQKNIEIIKELI